MQKTIHLSLFLLVSMLLGITGEGREAFAKTYYVAINGNDANPGTASQPWRTLAKAGKQVRPGDLVMIGAGTYSEMLQVTRSGTAAANIVFLGDKANPPVIEATGKRHGVIIWGASHIRIQGLRIQKSLRSGIHIHDHADSVDHGADFNVIEGNFVQECGKDGLNGIYVGGHNNRIIDNQVLDSGRLTSATSGEGHGIYVLGNNNLVRGNRVVRSAKVGIRMLGENNGIESNQVVDNRDFGLTIWVDSPLKGENITIMKNVFENNRRGGISIYGEGSGQKPKNITITENKLTHTKAEYGIRLTEAVSNVTITGNQLSGQYTTAFLYLDENAGAGFAETNNLFCGLGSFYYLGKTYASFDGYKAASQQGAGSRYIASQLPGDCK